MDSVTVVNGIVCISNEFEMTYLPVNQIAMLKVSKKTKKDGLFSVDISTKNDDIFCTKISLAEKDILLQEWLSANEILS